MTDTGPLGGGRGHCGSSQQIGGALGIAALSTIATSQTDVAVAAGTGLPVALVDGFTAAVGILAALTLIRRDELEQAPLAVEPALELAV